MTPKLSALNVHRFVITCSHPWLTLCFQSETPANAVPAEEKVGGEEPPATVAAAASDEGAPKFKSALLQQMLGKKGRLGRSTEKLSSDSKSSSEEKEEEGEKGLGDQRKAAELVEAAPEVIATEVPSQKADMKIEADLEQAQQSLEEQTQQLQVEQQPQVEQQQEMDHDQQPAVEEEQQPLIEQDQQPAVEQEQPPLIEQDQQPAVEKEQPPLIEQDQQPAVEQEQPPLIEQDQQPAVEQEQPPLIEQDQQLAVEQEQPPLIEQDQQPAVEQEQPPLIEQDQQPAVEQEQPPLIEQDQQLAVEQEQPPLMEQAEVEQEWQPQVEQQQEVEHDQQPLMEQAGQQELEQVQQQEMEQVQQPYLEEQGEDVRRNQTEYSEEKSVIQMADIVVQESTEQQGFMDDLPAEAEPAMSTESLKQEDTTVMSNVDQPADSRDSCSELGNGDFVGNTDIVTGGNGEVYTAATPSSNSVGVSDQDSKESLRERLEQDKDIDTAEFDSGAAHAPRSEVDTVCSERTETLCANTPDLLDDIGSAAVNDGHHDLNGFTRCDDNNDQMLQLDSK